MTTKSPESVMRITWRALAVSVIVAGLALAVIGNPGVLRGGSGLFDAPAQQPSSEVGPNRAQGSTIVVGAPGLRWTDITPTQSPTLWNVLRSGSTAQLSVKSVGPFSCASDGWLGLSAGGAVAAPNADGSTRTASDTECPAIAAPTEGRIPNWSNYVETAASSGYGASLGALADTADLSQACVQAIGPGAALAAARSNGTVAHYLDFDFADTTDPDGTRKLKLVTALAACPIVVVDGGEIGANDDRPTAVATTDDRLAQVIKAAPNGANIIIDGLADVVAPSRLRVIAATGPAFGTGQLSSSSTRQVGVAQAADVTSTTLHLANLDVPARVAGGLLQRVAHDQSPTSANARYVALLDTDSASIRITSVVAPFFQTVALTTLVLYLTLLWLARRGPRPSIRSTMRFGYVATIFAASLPVASYLANLIPWWRWQQGAVILVGATVLWSAVVTSIAFAQPWHERLFGPISTVAVITTGVITLDVITGSRLQLSSLLGLQPIIGGRFYGIGNVTFAVFAAATLILAATASDYFVTRERPRRAGLAAALIIGLAIVIDGAPFLGADGGGPPALLLGGGYLVATVSQVRLTWRRIVGFGGVTLAAFVAVTFLDWLRPPESRTHLGRFFESVRSGDAIDIIVRKAEQNWQLLTGQYRFTILVPVLLLAMLYQLFARNSWFNAKLAPVHRAAPTLRPALIAIWITSVIAFLINDSGAAVPAVAAMLALPFLVSTVAALLAGRAQSRVQDLLAEQRNDETQHLTPQRTG